MQYYMNMKGKMMIEIPVAGISFFASRFDEVAMARPVGRVTFVPVEDNEYDENAVAILWNGKQLGWVPKGDKQPIALQTGEGVILDYKYYHPEWKKLGIDKWNDQHIGSLKSVSIGIGKEDEYGDSIGGKYMRVSSFIKYFDHYGGGDGLIKWAFNQGSTYEEYEEALNECAENGTLMHDAIEKFFTDGTKSDLLPDGFDNFLDKYEPEFLWGEERFRDNELMITGQPDFVGYITHKGKRVLACVDWKSSSQVRPSHRTQISIYTKNVKVPAEPEVAMVVAWGADTKQGFSASVLERNEIENKYLACRYIRKVMDLMHVWVDESKFL